MKMEEVVVRIMGDASSLIKTMHAAGGAMAKSSQEITASANSLANTFAERLATIGKSTDAAKVKLLELQGATKGDLVDVKKYLPAIEALNNYSENLARGTAATLRFETAQDRNNRRIGEAASLWKAEQERLAAIDSLKDAYKNKLMSHEDLKQGTAALDKQIISWENYNHMIKGTLPKGAVKDNIDAMNASLTDQHAIYSKTKTEIARYRLEQEAAAAGYNPRGKGAEDLAIKASFVENDRLLKQESDRIQKEKDAAKAAQDTAQAQAMAERVMRKYETSTERQTRQLHELSEMQKLAPIPVRKYAEAVKDIKKSEGSRNAELITEQWRQQSAAMRMTTREFEISEAARKGATAAEIASLRVKDTRMTIDERNKKFEDMGKDLNRRHETDAQRQARERSDLHSAFRTGTMAPGVFAKEEARISGAAGVTSNLEGMRDSLKMQTTTMNMSSKAAELYAAKQEALKHPLDANVQATYRQVVAEYKAYTAKEKHLQAIEDQKKAQVGVAALEQKHESPAQREIRQIMELNDMYAKAKKPSGGPEYLEEIRSIKGLTGLEGRMRSFNESLEHQSKTFGMTSRQAEIYRLEQETLKNPLDVNTNAMLANAKAWDATLTKQETAKAAMDRGKQITESVMTAEENRNKNIAEAKKLLDDKVITQDTYNRVLQQGLPTLNDLSGALYNLSNAFSQLKNMIIGTMHAYSMFNDRMTVSTSIMDFTGYNTEQLSKKMEQHALNMSTKWAKSPDQLAEAYYFLSSAGFKVKETMDALEPMTKFAIAGNFDLSTAVSLSTDALHALRMEGNSTVETIMNLTRVTDVLVKADALANASAMQFSKALTRDAAAGLRIYGKTIEEGVAALMAYASQGIKAEHAGSTLDRMTRMLAKSAFKNAEAHRRLGFDVFDPLTGKMKKYSDMIANLEQITAGMTDEQRAFTLLQLGFEARLQHAILPLIGMSKDMKRFERELDAAGGTVDKVANNQMISFAKQMQLVWNEVRQASIEIGRSLAPAVIALGETIKGLVLIFMKVNEATGGWITRVVAIGALLTGLAVIIALLKVAITFLITAAIVPFIAILKTAAIYVMGFFMSFQVLLGAGLLGFFAALSLAVAAVGAVLLVVGIVKYTNAWKDLNAELERNLKLSRQLAESKTKRANKILEDSKNKPLEERRKDIQDLIDRTRKELGDLDYGKPKDGEGSEGIQGILNQLMSQAEFKHKRDAQVQAGIIRGWDKMVSDQEAKRRIDLKSQMDMMGLGHLVTPEAFGPDRGDQQQGSGLLKQLRDAEDKLAKHEEFANKDKGLIDWANISGGQTDLLDDANLAKLKNQIEAYKLEIEALKGTIDKANEEAKAVPKLQGLNPELEKKFGDFGGDLIREVEDFGLSDQRKKFEKMKRDVEKDMEVRKFSDADRVPINARFKEAEDNLAKLDNLRHDQKFGDYIRELEKENETLGKTGFEAELAKKGLTNLTEAQRQQVQVLHDKNKAIKKENKEWDDFKKRVKDSEQLVERLRTPEEKFSDTVRELNNDLRDSLIDWDTYSRAVNEAATELDRAAVNAQKLEAIQGAAFQSSESVARMNTYLQGLDVGTGVGGGLSGGLQQAVQEVVQPLGGKRPQPNRDAQENLLRDIRDLIRDRRPLDIRPANLGG